MWERAVSILIKEFKQMFRDPRMKTVIFITPLIQIILFGYAANRDITYVPMAVIDQDNTKESRELLRDFTYSKYFVPKYYLATEKDQNWVLDKGLASLVVRMDRGFGRDLRAGKDASVQLAFDGSDSNTLQVIMGYTNTILENFNYRLLKEEAFERGGIRDHPNVDLRDRAWFNGNLISRNYYLPGVIATIVTMMSLLLSSMAIVKEKEIGTMEQLIVSPIRPLEFIIGKLLPFGIIALIQVVIVTAVGVLWFSVPLRGSILLLLFACFIYLFTTLGVGLFISTISSTQQEAMMSVFLFYMPSVLLSGFAYPIANMPRIIQLVTYLNPLRYFMVIIRGIFLKGVGINVLWPEFSPLVAMGLCVIVMSSMQFGKKLG